MNMTRRLLFAAVAIAIFSFVYGEKPLTTNVPLKSITTSTQKISKPVKPAEKKIGNNTAN